VEWVFCVPAQLDFIPKHRGYSYSVLLAMTSFCGHQVGDPKDRVYGMLGLGAGEYAHLVDPDYSLSEEQICQAVVIKSVERTGTLEFLSQLFEHEREKWPSFLPNWVGKYSWSGVYRLRLGSLHFFRASLDTTAQLSLIHPRFMGIHALSLIKSHPPLLSIDFYPVRTTYKRYMGLQTWIKPLDNSTPTCSRKVALCHALCEGFETINWDSNSYSLTKYTQNIKQERAEANESSKYILANSTLRNTSPLLEGAKARARAPSPEH
jgi:hypothetical protein